MLFICLNPSTADDTLDDPTIRRIMGFAKRWDYGSVTIGNIFAFRTVSPVLLKKALDPVGPENDDWLLKLKSRAARVVVGWGNHGAYRNRAQTVRKLLKMETLCLGENKSGQPVHPLYIPRDRPLRIWREL